MSCGHERSICLLSTDCEERAPQDTEALSHRNVEKTYFVLRTALYAENKQLYKLWPRKSKTVEKRSNLMKYHKKIPLTLVYPNFIIAIHNDDPRLSHTFRHVEAS